MREDTVTKYLMYQTVIELHVLIKRKGEADTAYVTLYLPLKTCGENGELELVRFL